MFSRVWKLEDLIVIFLDKLKQIGSFSCDSCERKNEAASAVFMSFEESIVDAENTTRSKIP